MSSSWWKLSEWSEPSSWEWHSNTTSSSSWQEGQSWQQAQQWTATTKPTEPVRPPKALLPDHFQSDDKFYDRQPVGKGSHQLFRTVQPTEWSRKTSLAGRPIEDIRAWELSHRGLSEFSFRLLSEGRYQGIVWTRSASEAVFLTQLMKRIREVGVDIDEVARTFHTDVILSLMS